ncbi:hypothetical protein B7Y94_02135 [Candidatus Saccharibacteria bacterium 32-49-12]|nr:MAG: hypothetical protein B7Y94_02135 [Candidatus Saccharibacteria bacterium 32-49-12]
MELPTADNRLKAEFDRLRSELELAEVQLEESNRLVQSNQNEMRQIQADLDNADLARYEATTTLEKLETQQPVDDDLALRISEYKALVDEAIRNIQRLELERGEAEVNLSLANHGRIEALHRVSRLQTSLRAFDTFQISV